MIGQKDLNRLHQQARNLRERIRKCRRQRETLAHRELKLELERIERAIDATEAA